jgi:hypothetical protein
LSHDPRLGCALFNFPGNLAATAMASTDPDASSRTFDAIGMAVAPAA